MRFLQERNRVNDFLLNQAKEPLPGVSFAGPLQKNVFDEFKSDGEESKDMDEAFRNAIYREDYHTFTTIEWMVDLGEEALAVDKQGNSDTMCAMVLLNHYFGGLSQFGFRNNGRTISVSTTKVQSASDTWYREGNYRIIVHGSVFVALASHMAIVRLNIDENFPKQ